MFHRFLAAFGLVVAVALAGAAPALAHEELNPAIITTGQPTFFTLSAANEEKVELVKVTVIAPKGVPFGTTTRTPPGWTAAPDGDNAISWSASAGQGVHPDLFETWGFETDGANQAGVATYKVGLTFADGKTKDVNVPVTVTTPAAPKTETSRTPKDNESPVALVLSAVALGVAAIALVVSATRRKASPATADASTVGKW